jgi:mRNA-degrading endonuclease toxin of MazEF toxin-antitoxin module
VIVQSDLIGLTSTVLVVPTSTKSQPATFRPRINLPDGPTYALTEQTRAMDRAAVGPSVGRLEAHEMLAVDRALKLTFGLVSYLA